MLLKMPGINTKNVYSVMNRVESIAQLVTLSLSELTEIMGSSGNAKQLYDFINSEDQVQAATGVVADAQPKTVKWKAEPVKKSTRR
jgi:ERCC4-type nuclease